MPQAQTVPVPEIGLVGDLTDNECDLTERLLDVPAGGQCVFYIDSPGGSPYTGMSLMSLVLLRGLRATGVVTGECSSAALWLLGACTRRIVTPCSVLLFHPMKWQSEEHVRLAEAAEWARHFGQLETQMDELLAQLFGIPFENMARWMQPGRYVSGRELAGAGLAELVELKPLELFSHNGAPRARRRETQQRGDRGKGRRGETKTAGGPRLADG